MASAVESTSTVDCATTANCTTAAMEVAATARRNTMESGIAAESALRSARSRTAESRSAMEYGSTVPAVAVEAMEPRTRADKDPSGKIARAIVAVRSAGVRSEPIVAIGADRSRTDEDRANLNRDLCMGSARHHNEKSYQSHIF
jgi:hypothetical protein